ncbi:unnamed protein product [Heterobilharzia americana]|nr:unnamed protein product [Heterobilharzia americana]
MSALLYLFVGVAVSSDVFMYSIEKITAKKCKIKIYDRELGKFVEDEVFIWNETVANLTLMALGSSAPEILLACIEAFKGLHEESHGVHSSLGLFTIVGSASFNLLIISGICILSIPSPTVKKIDKFNVFILTSFFSLFAYVWMLLVVVYISPAVIELWESVLTLLFFPFMVLLAYAQDNGWWQKDSQMSKEGGDMDGHLSGNFVPKAVNDGNCDHLEKGTSNEFDMIDKRKNIALDGIKSPTDRRRSEYFVCRKSLVGQRFRHTVLNKLTNLDQHTRKGTMEMEQMHEGLSNEGKIFFNAHTYTIHFGAKEVILPVIFQRGPVSTRDDGKIIRTSLNQTKRESVSEQDTSKQSVHQNSKENETNNAKKCHLSSQSSSTVFYEIRSGTAIPGLHYVHTSGGHIPFGRFENERRIVIQLNPNVPKEYTHEKLDFYVVLSVEIHKILKTVPESTKNSQITIKRIASNQCKKLLPFSHSPLLLFNSCTVEVIKQNEGCYDSEVGWAEQFSRAVSLVPSVNEDGIEIPLTKLEYALHGITFFWKLICALLPPRKYLGAYPTFIASLLLIGLQTAFIEELSNLLGCTAGMKTAVTGISLVALGTSLPDVFVSRAAAIYDKNADNSIGNITDNSTKILVNHQLMSPDLLLLKLASPHLPTLFGLNK